MIEADRLQADGSREVLAIASRKFSDNTKRMKVLFLILNDHIIGGQVLRVPVSRLAWRRIFVRPYLFNLTGGSVC